MTFFMLQHIMILKSNMDFGECEVRLRVQRDAAPQLDVNELRPALRAGAVRQAHEPRPKLAPNWLQTGCSMTAM